MSGQFLHTEGVAEMLGVSTRTVAEWTRTRSVPMRKIAGVRRVFFDPEEVREWVDAGGGLELVIEEKPRGGLVVRPKRAEGVAA
jgi:excisionase family DNA binding protein